MTARIAVYGQFLAATSRILSNALDRASNSASTRDEAAAHELNRIIAEIQVIGGVGVRAALKAFLEHVGRATPPDHGVGRSRGGLSTKIHQLVDGNGLPLVTLVISGQAGDSPMFLPLMAQLGVGRYKGRPRTRPDEVRSDKAYSSRAIRGHLRSRGSRP